MPPQKAAAPNQTPKTKPPYVMPKPESAIVEWRHSPNDHPQFAVVTLVGKSAISVAIIPPDSRAMIPKDGVRHIGDPLLQSQVTDGGVWDFTEETKVLQQLKAIVLASGGQSTPPPDEDA